MSKAEFIRIHPSSDFILSETRLTKPSFEAHVEVTYTMYVGTLTGAWTVGSLASFTRLIGNVESVE